MEIDPVMAAACATPAPNPTASTAAAIAVLQLFLNIFGLPKNGQYSIRKLLSSIHA
jgi:hypothetical protein